MASRLRIEVACSRNPDPVKTERTAPSTGPVRVTVTPFRLAEIVTPSSRVRRAEA
jgi:hypothetical protein